MNPIQKTYSVYTRAARVARAAHRARARARRRLRLRLRLRMIRVSIVRSCSNPLCHAREAGHDQGHDQGHDEES